MLVTKNDITHHPERRHAVPSLTNALRAEYQSLFDTCQINPARQAEVEQIANQIIANQHSYEAVGKPLGMPWYVVAVLHAMEASLNFNCHLHNGDPLSRRTTHVPKGRPLEGAPPFEWEFSARDALVYDKFPGWTDWSIPGILYKCELYNGWGYRAWHPEVKTPYLWSATNHYQRGKYVEDGTFNPSATSKQIGGAAILRRLAEKGVMDAPSHGLDADLVQAIAKGTLGYNTKKEVPGARALQRFLNQFPGVFLREDGVPGEKTSTAYKQVFGQYLKGDPRAG
jgi:lysozyme family protein